MGHKNIHHHSAEHAGNGDGEKVHFIGTIALHVEYNAVVTNMRTRKRKINEANNIIFHQSIHRLRCKQKYYFAFNC